MTHPATQGLARFKVYLRSKVQFSVNTVQTGCLSRSNYKEDKCQSQIDALYECCNAFYQKQGDEARTVSCPKPDLLR